MPKAKIFKHGDVEFTQEDLDAVASPPLSPATLKKMRPAAEVVPDIVEEYRRTRGPGKRPNKVAVSIRLDPDVVDEYKQTGSLWQKRVNDDLRAALRRKKLKKAAKRKGPSHRKSASRKRA
jgi:uncharacterized protein (DUF4415 family)